MVRRTKKDKDGVDKELQAISPDPIPLGPDGELMLRPIDVREILDIIDAEDDAAKYKEAAKNLKEKTATRLGREISYVSALVASILKDKKDPEALPRQSEIISVTEQFKVMEDSVQAQRRRDQQNEEIRAQKKENQEHDQQKPPAD